VQMLILTMQATQVHKIARELPSWHDCSGRSMVSTKVQLFLACVDDEQRSCCRLRKTRCRYAVEFYFSDPMRAECVTTAISLALHHHTHAAAGYAVRARSARTGGGADVDSAVC